MHLHKVLRPQILTEKLLPVSKTAIYLTLVCNPVSNIVMKKCIIKLGYPNKNRQNKTKLPPINRDKKIHGWRLELRKTYQIYSVTTTMLLVYIDHPTVPQELVSAWLSLKNETSKCTPTKLKDFLSGIDRSVRHNHTCSGCITMNPT